MLIWTFQFYVWLCVYRMRSWTWVHEHLNRFHSHYECVMSTDTIYRTERTFPFFSVIRIQQNVQHVCHSPTNIIGPYFLVVHHYFVGVVVILNGMKLFSTVATNEVTLARTSNTYFNICINVFEIEIMFKNSTHTQLKYENNWIFSRFGCNVPLHSQNE